MQSNEQIPFLGKENISKLILKFSIPCILSLLVSALYNIVDQIFIGNSELSADTQKETEKNIHHSDEARATYYHNISGLRWGDAHNYDSGITITS